MSEVKSVINQVSLPGCKLTRTGIIFDQQLPYEKWKNILDFAKTVNGASMFWIGDALNYGYALYGEMTSQEEGDGKYKYSTLRNAKWVSSVMKLSRRRDNLSFAHHREVAALPQEGHEYWLNKAESEGLNRKELRRQIKESKKPPLPELKPGKFNVIYADPPWDVQAGPEWGSGGESRDLTYPTMTIEEIKAMEVLKIADDNAHLYLWTINKYVEESYQIARSWGFEPSCLLTWVKGPHGIGLGGTFVQTSEYLLFCRRGTLEASKRIDTSWFDFPRGKHSEKPEGFRKMIEDVSPGSRIELFARKKSPGWEVFGNEV